MACGTTISFFYTIRNQRILISSLVCRTPLINAGKFFYVLIFPYTVVHWRRGLIIRSTRSHFHIFYYLCSARKNILLYRDTILNLKQKAHGNQTGNTCFYLCVLVFEDYLSCFSIILYKSHVTCHVTNWHFVNIMTLNLDCIYGSTRFPSGSTSVACGL